MNWQKPAWLTNILFLNEGKGVPPRAPDPVMEGPPGLPTPLALVNPGVGAPVPYRCIPIDFSNAKTNVEFDFNGNLFYLVYATSGGGVVPILNVRVNDTQNDAIPLTAGVGFRGMPFTKLFLSNIITGTETGFLFIALGQDEQETAAA